MSNHFPSGNPVRPRVCGKALSAILLPLVVAAVVVGEDFDLSRSTIDGGGIMFSTGGDFELSGTIGQPDAGVMSNGPFALTGGFWFQQVPADCNRDGGVDLYDYASFEACMAQLRQPPRAKASGSIDRSSHVANRPCAMPGR